LIFSLVLQEKEREMRTVTLEGGGELPVGKILCIGRNYVDHIRELGNEAPDRPVVFLKPSTSIVPDGGRVVIPSYSSDCHHEGELALLVGKEGKDIAQETALDFLAGYGVAIDLTLRDVQAELKKKGLPWDIAKGFDTACPVSTFVPASRVRDPQDLRIVLTVNGETRQDGSTSLMIHPVAEIVAYLSTFFTLEPGDVILTGTPAGVSAIRSGDTVRAEVAGIASVTVTVG
jgi:acylpyruvate hydrolase